MDPEQIIVTMRAKDMVEKEQEIKRKAYKNGERFKAKKRGLGKNAVKKSIIILFLGFFFSLATFGVSLILAIIAVPLIFIYYYGIKKQSYEKKEKNTTYICPYCENTYRGPQKICPFCRKKVKYDISEYKCGYCGHKFTTREDKCPNCGVGLYYE